MEEKEEVLNTDNVSTSTVSNQKTKNSNVLSIVTLVVAVLALIVSGVSLIISLSNSFVFSSKEFKEFNKLFDQFTNSEKSENGGSFFDKINDMMEKGDQEFNVSSFNTNLELYKGTQDANSVYSLLDNVITKLKTNSEHPITVIYNTTTTTSADDVLSLKNSILEGKKYEISFDYDSNGYINKATIFDK